MKIYFSEERLGFFFYSLIELYKENEAWPSDAVEINVEEYELYQSQPPTGMCLGTKNGHPNWVELIADNDEDKD